MDARSKCLILVVDDDIEDHMILLDYFTEAGLSEIVVFVQNAQQAIEFLHDKGAHGRLPKLIILDLNMPILNGTQTLQLIKDDQHFSQIPTIIFSTSENELEKRKCLDLGAIDYIVKPTSLEEGQKMVKRFVSFL